MKYRNKRPDETLEEYTVWLENFRIVDNAARAKRRATAKVKKQKSDEMYRLSLLNKVEGNPDTFKSDYRDTMALSRFDAEACKEVVYAKVMLIYGCPYLLRLNAKGEPGLCTSLMQHNWMQMLRKSVLENDSEQNWISNYSPDSELMKNIRILRKSYNLNIKD